jgi:Zn-dependent protease
LQLDFIDILQHSSHIESNGLLELLNLFVGFLNELAISLIQFNQLALFGLLVLVELLPELQDVVYAILHGLLKLLSEFNDSLAPLQVLLALFRDEFL